ncbi:hypothetical protein FJT64_006462 [Amphibalanus amphitrite]|uniref:Uncharacterized protein n=1 Tax=Amphibalanus amphitrite TaxID=1232801 RepID=A0A6A4VI22_AMPAM|nr:hypothetical protein FJT64_006462 [Amphibalanus amphitrite]
MPVGVTRCDLDQKSSMDALTEPAVCRCVAELVARLHWSSVSLQALPGAALLLAPLLLAVARRGVFISAAPDPDRAADGAVLPTDSLAAVANGRGRPLLVLALRGTTERRLAGLLRPLGGALVYDVLSGAVYRTARYADVGPPVQRLGTCHGRVVRLSDDIGRPSPIGWQDLRLVNTTLSSLYFGRPAPVSRVPLLGGPFAGSAGRLLLAGITLLLVLASYLATRGSGGGPAGSWLQAVALFSNQGLAARPGRLWQLVAAGVGCLAALLTAQLYTAGLLSRVTTEVTELPFNQLDDVLDAPGWQWGYASGTATEEMLFTSGRRGANFASCSTTLKKNSRVGLEFFYKRAENERIAFFAPAKGVEERCTWNSCPKLCRHPEHLYRSRYSVPFRRDDPNVPTWRLAFLRMLETGIWTRLRRRHEPPTGVASFECEFEPRPRSQYAPLELAQCSAAFRVLLIGVTVSCCLCLGEVVAARLCRQVTSEEGGRLRAPSALQDDHLDTSPGRLQWEPKPEEYDASSPDPKSYHNDQITVMD